MVDMPTAVQQNRSATRSGIDSPARSAGLRAVGGGYFDELPAAPGELVAKHLDESAPPGSADSPGKRATLNHVGNLKTLDDDRAVALGVGGGERVKEMVTLPADLAVQPVHAIDGLLSVLGSFLSPGDDALSSGKPLERGFEVFGVRDEIAVRVGDQMRDAAIEGDDRLGPRLWIGQLHLADDRGEPLVAFAPNRAGLRFALERSVHDSSQITELGKAQRRALEAPDLRVRLGETETVALPCASSAERELSA